jgi:hypothetical protein
VTKRSNLPNPGRESSAALKIFEDLDRRTPALGR